MCTVPLCKMELHSWILFSIKFYVHLGNRIVLLKQYSNSATSIRKSKLLLPNPNTVSVNFLELQVDFVKQDSMQGGMVGNTYLFFYK